LIEVRGNAGDLHNIWRKWPGHGGSPCFIVQAKLIGIQLNCQAVSIRQK